MSDGRRVIAVGKIGPRTTRMRVSHDRMAEITREASRLRATGHEIMIVPDPAALAGSDDRGVRITVRRSR